MDTLSHAEITVLLEKLPGWHHRGNAIEKHFDRADFKGAIAFVQAIADAANAQDHHPDLSISWNDVGVTLSSHDAGGLTGRDFRLAEIIERLGAT
jgi:4a-hydroxytetrahydrobiopterin dehydratase